jgi:diguanylate cyclase (GGDEF)-like protein
MVGCGAGAIEGTVTGANEATTGSQGSSGMAHPPVLSPSFEEATRDRLTGLTNRDMLAAIAERELLRARRKGDPLSIVSVDIDCFAQLTRHLGEAAAGRLLKRLAQLLVGNTRSVDLPARVGMESFAVLLPETPAQGALIVAERVRSKIEALDLSGIDPAIDHLTGSLGVASTDWSVESFDDLMRRAADALRQAKLEGRNRVVAAR